MIASRPSRASPRSRHRPLQASLWRHCHGQGGSEPSPYIDPPWMWHAHASRALHILVQHVSPLRLLEKRIAASVLAQEAMHTAWRVKGTLSGSH